MSPLSTRLTNLCFHTTTKRHRGRELLWGKSDSREAAKSAELGVCEWLRLGIFLVGLMHCVAEGNDSSDVS